jgi:hypothetical protein
MLPQNSIEIPQQMGGVFWFYETKTMTIQQEYSEETQMVVPL